MNDTRLALVCAALAAVLAGCGSHGAGADDPVSRLFEDHYPEFVAAAKAHHAGCDLALSAKGTAGSKHDSLSTSVDVDANGSYRVVHDEGAELVRVGQRTWTRPKDGKAQALEAGAQADLARDAAVAEWRSVLEPLRSHVKLKAAGSGRLGSRPTEMYEISFDTSASGDAPKVEKGAGKFELDEETGFPVKVDLTLVWTAKGADGTRVSYSLDKMGCAVTQLGAVAPIVPPEPIPGASGQPVEAQTATPAPASTKATPAPTAKAEKHDAKGTAGKSGKKPK